MTSRHKRFEPLGEGELEELNRIAYAYRCARLEHPDEVRSRYDELVAHIEKLRGDSYDAGCDYYL